MNRNAIKIQRFRANDLVDDGGKQFELGKSWCDDFFEFDRDSSEVIVNLVFKSLNYAHERFNDKNIELKLADVSKRGDRKAYANGENGRSQIKDFFINDLHLSYENNSEDYFGIYKSSIGEYYLYFIPKPLYENFIKMFVDLTPNVSIQKNDEKIKSRNINLPLQRIYYGAPGTGKSYEINELTKNCSTIRTTFHPDTDYSTFVGAYKPTTGLLPICDELGQPMKIGSTVLQKEQIIYEFVEQAFLQAYVAAWKKYGDAGAEETPKDEYLIIEEINRGNCAQIFGDLFQLLDRGDEGFSEYPIKADADMKKQLAKEFAGMKIAKADCINALYDGETDVVGKVLSGEILLLPNNLYIWATMNTSDQSLFPIDSAFKRRWDWQYVPIGNAEKGWTIDVNGNKYDWWQFLSFINDKVYEATYSEDKKLGYFFCKAKDGVITVDKFVSKVIFYLWNDVFKDSEFEGDAFKDEKGDKLSFDKFYIAEGNKAKVNTANVEQFLKNLGLEPISTDDTEEYHGQEESKDDTENNDWSDVQKKRYEYWDAFLKYAPEHNADFAKYFGGIKKASKDHWKNFFISGVRDFYLVAIQQRRKNVIEMQVYFEETTDTYHKLYAHKDEIEQELGIRYSWEEMPDKKSSIISEEKPNVDFDNKDAWHEQFDFIIGRLLRMRETFLKFSNM